MGNKKTAAVVTFTEEQTKRFNTAFSQHVSRIERAEEEVREMQADVRELYAGAKADGYDLKALKRVIKERRKKPVDREEEQAIFDLYWSELEGVPLPK